MITKENFKSLLKALNFEQKGEIFSKHFSNNEAYLKVNFTKNLLVYPQDKGFKVSGDFTCNFSSDENFVVFECVNRLFEKGYKPEHIELEPKWKVGHGASGGRADILVKDNSGKPLLIIECKTEGNEFKKEWNNTLQRGGQMFSYAKQAGSAQYVCLYASDFVDGKVVYFSNVISLNDNKKLLEELADKKPLSFKEAKALEVEDIYKAWRETYNLDFASKGIFEDDIQPYQIGKKNYSVVDLAEVGSNDIQSKYHEFATILRKHNVSGRENAFDKLVNLFLCKIVDEAKNPKDLKFNWKGIAYDNDFDLIDRLQTLYQTGMKEFLGEDVANVSRKQIVSAFKYVKQDPDATQEKVLKFFRELKYFKNSDFSFIDVHNEKLFYQNAKILLEIVKMLQDTRLQSENQNQFLGDMFEGFLDNGVKQSEGQFFTPMPIVKFILNSLPLESLIQENELPPKAIDYACGAGHFLNELALQIKPYVEKHQETNIKEYYKQIVGVEKEYRLSKVAKVSAFMYGQDDIKITYADALGSNAKLQENGYSILVANPPYAVKGFLQTLSETERKAFTLLTSIDEKSIGSNNSIETFFIERAKQLLKPNAVAGIILPSSILSNDSSLYTSAREIILKYFQIVAIAEFGSQTFGKTGTNTVTIFLRKKEENPSPAEHFKNRVDAWFSGNQAGAIYGDSHIINSYCNHISIDATQYKTLLDGKPSEGLLKTEMFVDYKKAFENLSEIKNLKKPFGAFNKKSEAEQKEEIAKRLTEYLQEIEKDKIYFYALAFENKQKVLVVKAPSDNKEQKKFLGYEWSSAKGNEGIKYLNQSSVAIEAEDAETKEMISKLKGLHHIKTPLYNPKNRNDKSKINYYIEQNFLGNELPINQDLKPFISYYQTTELLDFTRKDFDKQIQLSQKKVSTELVSKYESVKIESVLLKINGNTTKIPSNEIIEKGSFPVVTQEQGSLISGYTNNKNSITDLPLILFGDHSCTFKFVDFPFVRGADGTQLLKVNTNLFLSKCFYYLVQLVEIENKDKYERHFKYLSNAKIPLPPLEIQQKLVDECNLVDKETKEANSKIEKAKAEIENLFLSVSKNAKEVKILNLNHLLKRGKSTKYGSSKIQIIKSGQARGYTSFDFKEKHFVVDGFVLDERKLQKGDLLINSTGVGTAGRVTLFDLDGDFVVDSHVTIFRPNEQLNSKYALYCFANIGFKNIEKMAKGSSGQIELSLPIIEDIKIPVPPIAEQKKLVGEIEKLEQIIKFNQAIIDSSLTKKKAIMKKYL